MIVEAHGLMARPHKSGKCWTVLERRTIAAGTDRERVGWVNVGTYPSTLAAALEEMRELAIMRDPSAVSTVEAFQAALARFEERHAPLG